MQTPESTAAQVPHTWEYSVYREYPHSPKLSPDCLQYSMQVWAAASLCYLEDGGKKWICLKKKISQDSQLSKKKKKIHNCLKWKLLVCLESYLCQMMFYWVTQVKGWLAKADKGKNVFLKQTQVKGCFDIVDTWVDAWWRSLCMTPHTVGDVHWALVWFTLVLLFFANVMHFLVCLT